VPILAGELESIAKAQASRGANFGSGRGGPIAKARAYLPLFVPVTIRALERAEILAEAMEARGYAEEGRTRLASYPRQKGESLVKLAALAACAASFIIDYVFK
jgi:energy-coupling factor transport system permease protein